MISVSLQLATHLNIDTVTVQCCACEQRGKGVVMLLQGDYVKCDNVASG